MSDQETVYALTGQDKGAKAVFNDVGASIARAADRTDKAAKSVSDLAAKLDRSAAAASKAAIASNKNELALAGLGEKLDFANRNLTSFGAGIPGVEMGIKALTNPVALLTGGLLAGGIAVSKFALDNADLVEQLSNMEAVTGLTVDQLYSMRDVALSSGVSFEGMAKNVSKMETELGRGNKELKALGLTGVDAVEDIARVADAWNAATTQAEKNRIAMAAFGKGFQDMIPLLQQGGDAIRKVGEGRQIDIQKYRELDETVDGIGQSWRDIKFALGDIAAGPLNVLLSGFEGILNLTRDTLDGWDELLSRGGGPNVGVAEEFLKKYATQAYVPGKVRQQQGLNEITPANREKLLADLASQSVAERIRILDGLNNLTKENAGSLKLLLDESGNIKGLNPADLGRIQRQANLDKKATPPETDEEKAARERAEQKELEFRRDLARRIEELTASSDDRELIAIRNKYAKLIDEHKGYNKTVIDLQKARDDEILAYQVKQNADLQLEANKAFFDATGIDWATYLSLNPGGNESEQGQRSLTIGMHSARRTSAINTVKSSGIGNLSGDTWTYQTKSGKFSDYQQIDLASSTTQEIQDAFQVAAEAQIRFIDQSRENAEAFQKQWQGVYDSISTEIASNLAPALIDLFSRPQDALQQFGDLGKKILSDLATQLLEVGIKWTLLSAFAGGAGGKSPGTFLSFLSKSFGGHADGTLSSPGGLKYLGEQGPEAVTTPLGSRYMASYGLYQVPAGTKVEKSATAPIMLSAPITIQASADPIQTAEQVKRAIREVYAEIADDEYRTRNR